MGQILHGCATTTEAVRREYKIKRYGINQKTAAKWKQRETVADLPTGPAKPSQVDCPFHRGRGGYRCYPAALQAMLSQRVHPVA